MNHSLKIILFFVLLVIPISFAQDWTDSNSGTTQMLHGIFIMDEQKAWIVGGEGAGSRGHPILLKTENGGSSWTEVPLPTSLPSTTILKDICFNSLNKGWIVGGAALLKTENGGISWLSQDYPGNGILNSIACLGENKAIAVGFPASSSDGIIRTTDGIRWTSGYNPLDSTLTRIYFKDRNYGLAVGQNTILKTINGGATWGDITTVDDVSLSGVTCKRTDNTCWLAGWGRNIYKKIGEGAWIAVDASPLDTQQGGLFTDIEWKNATLGILTGEGILLESGDAGTTWNFASTSVSSPLGLLPVPWMYKTKCGYGACYAIGSNGLILRRGEPILVPQRGNLSIAQPNTPLWTVNTPTTPQPPVNCPTFMDDCEAGYHPIPEYGTDGCINDYTCVDDSVLSSLNQFGILPQNFGNFNRQLTSIPGLGQNERVNIDLTQNDGTQRTFFIELTNKKIKKISSRESENPTLILKTSETTINHIRDSTNPRQEVFTAIDNGKINIEATSFFGKIKLGLGKFLLKFL